MTRRKRKKLATSSNSSSLFLFKKTTNQTATHLSYHREYHDSGIKFSCIKNEDGTLSLTLSMDKKNFDNLQSFDSFAEDLSGLTRWLKLQEYVSSSMLRIGTSKD